MDPQTGRENRFRGLWSGLRRKKPTDPKDKGVSEAKKMEWIRRRDVGMIVFAIWLIFASSGGLATLLSLIPSFLAPDLDQGLREHGKTVDDPPAFEVGLGSAVFWDVWIGISSGLTAVVAMVFAFIYIYMVRKKEKLAQKVELGKGSGEEGEVTLYDMEEAKKAISDVNVIYWVFGILNIVVGLHNLTMFIKFMVIIANAATKGVTDDARGFVIYWASLTAFTFLACCLYGSFLIVQAVWISRILPELKEKIAKLRRDMQNEAMGFQSETMGQAALFGPFNTNSQYAPPRSQWG